MMTEKTKTNAITNGEIYRIWFDDDNAINTTNGMSYIGQTRCAGGTRKRVREHIRNALNKRRDTPLLDNAIRQYGENALKYEILESGFRSQRELDEAERRYIAEYNTKAPNGYNIQDGGQYSCDDTLGDSTEDMRGKLAQLTSVAKDYLGDLSSSVPHCGTPIRGKQALYLVDGKVVVPKQRCHSRACPSCAHTLAISRAIEIEKALVAAQGKRWTTLFVTMTVPHSKEQTLKTSLDNLGEIWNRMRMYRIMRCFYKDNGFIGLIKSLDVTYSKRSGWHPHYHILLFFEATRAPKALFREYRKLLCNEYKKIVPRITGMKPSDQHGIKIQYVDLSDTNTASIEALPKYMSGISSIYNVLSPYRERGHLIPFDFLDEKGNEEFRKLYREYYEATKGIRQCIFSRGLKEKAGISEEPGWHARATKIVELSQTQQKALYSPSTRILVKNLIEAGNVNDALQCLSMLDVPTN